MDHLHIAERLLHEPTHHTARELEQLRGAGAPFPVFLLA